jgi:hypothetical protein
MNRRGQSSLEGPDQDDQLRNEAATTSAGASRPRLDKQLRQSPQTPRRCRSAPSWDSPSQRADYRWQPCTSSGNTIRVESHEGADREQLWTARRPGRC